MRLVFAGTPAVAVPSLRVLAAQHEIAAVLTRPDAPLGRRRVLTQSPVAAEAERLGLPLLKTARLDEDATARIQALRADLGVIVAYGGLVREPLLSAPREGWINLHFSLLPQWRGAAPVQRALIAGDVELGASIFRLVPELDAGDVFTRRVIPVPADATAGTALEVLAARGAEVLAEVVAGIADGSAVATPQDGEGSYAAKLGIADGALDWTAPVESVFARFRGTTPEPGAHTSVGGLRVKILDASPAGAAEPLAPGALRPVDDALLIGTGTTPISIRRLQPAGKGGMNALDWWRGARLADDVRAGE